jgi:hypothetical protein
MRRALCVAMLLLFIVPAGCSDKVEVERLQIQAKALEQQRDQAIAQRDGVKQQADVLAVANADLQTRLKAAADDVARLKAENLRYLKSGLYEIKQVPVPSKEVPASVLQGHVTAVDNEAGVAEIDLGMDDGVRQGMQFIVYGLSEQQSRATLTIKRVGPKRAAGNISLARGTMVEVGDKIVHQTSD